MSERLGLISSSLDDLEELHKKHKWIPGSGQVRPSEELLRIKFSEMERISREWDSVSSFILHSVFGKSVSDVNGVYTVIERDVSEECLFRPNIFPYGIEEGEHWVLWYGTTEQPYSNEDIDIDVYNAIKDHLTSEKFNYAWYLNPKVSVPQFFHVQVFWIAIEDSTPTSDTSTIFTSIPDSAGGAV